MSNTDGPEFSYESTKTGRWSGGSGGSNPSNISPAAYLQERVSKLCAARGRIIKVVKSVKCTVYDNERTVREVALLYAALRKAELGVPLDTFH